MAQTPNNVWTAWAKYISWGVLVVALLGIVGVSTFLLGRPANPTPDLIFIPLLRAGAVVTVSSLLMMLVLKNLEFTLFRRTKSAKWDFGDSWASISTAIASILTGLLGLTDLFGAEPNVSKLPVALSLFFGFLIILAPVLYNAVQLPDATASDAEPRGFIILYLLASTVVLWAAFGQLSTTQYLFDSLTEVPGETVQVFRGMFTAAQFVVACYAFFRIWSAVREQLKTDDDATDDPNASPQERYFRELERRDVERKRRIPIL